MEAVNITIIGAGAVGLSIAYELSKHYQDVIILERNSSFGQEISSRNSEVIHAGIYYPENSLKAMTCVEGRGLLYEYCKENNVNHKKIGKLIVAIDSSELNELKKLFENGLSSGVEDLRMLSKEEVKEIEPGIQAEAAIFSPSTGIVDSHGFMKSLMLKFENNKGQIAYDTEFERAEKIKDGFEVSVQDKREGLFKFKTRVLINSCGLNSDKVSETVGLKNDEYRLKYCKGDYFRVSSAKANFVKRLIYPVPKKDRAGLGIHVTLDLAGSMRLGPDDEYIEKIDYNVDSSKAKIFYESVKTFLPFIELKDIYPDTSGVRPKLQGEGEDFRDFIIKEETESGFRGFINLIGIESPGLTSSLSIAKMVRKMYNQLQKGIQIHLGTQT